MATYIETRIAELENALREPESLPEILRAIGLIRNAVQDIKSYLRVHPFANDSEEIHYFKVLAPPVFGRLMYLVKASDAGVEALHASNERMEAYLELELAKIAEFFRKHRDFCHYTLINETYMDDRIYIRDARENGMLDYIEVFMGDDFCVGCYWASLLWANQQLKVHFNDWLRKLKQPEGAIGDLSALPELEWTDGQTAMVELAYGFYAKGCFNHGKATLKEIIEWLEQHLKIDTGNFYNKVQEIARRKKGLLKFIDDMRERMVRKLEDLI
jgi:hypothetical protein